MGEPAITFLVWGWSCLLPFIFKMHKMVIYSKSESREGRGSVPGTSPTQLLTSSSQAPGMGNGSQGHNRSPHKGAGVMQAQTVREMKLL